MTFSNKVSRYPLEYLDMLQELEDNPETPIDIARKDEREARYLARKLNHFRSAIEADPKSEKWHNAAASMMVVQRQNVVLIMHRDFSPDAAEMREAIARAKARRKAIVGD